MTNYETLLAEAYDSGVSVKEKILKSDSDALILGNKIAIRKDIPTLVEKSCVLAEELGHFHTSTGNIIDLQDIRNRKQENTARLWAYNAKIGLLGIIHSYRENCRTLHEMAECLGVTEVFLQDALECYKSKYGICAKLDNYIIYFEPNLGIMELL